MVVVGVLRGVPPYGVLGVLVHYDVFVLGRTAGVDAGHYVDCTKLGHLTFVVAFEFGPGLLVVEDFVGGIVKNLSGSLDPILA